MSGNGDERDLIPEALMTRVADRLRVLGQPVRLRLVELLDQRPSTPQELSDALGLSQQNVSKHLLTLHRAGVVTRQPTGVNVIYTLVDRSAVLLMRLTLESVGQQLRDLSALALGRSGESGQALEDGRAATRS